MPGKLSLQSLVPYVWLLEQLRKAPLPGLTLEELQSRWQANPSHEGSLSRTTMTRYRKSIYDFLGVQVSAPDRKHYRIVNPESLHLNTLASELLVSLQEYMLLDEFRDLGNAIQPQQIWQGRDYLQDIGTAIRGRKKLQVTYQKFQDEAPYEAILHPYCLKASLGRWYLLAEKEQSTHPVQVFALDRTRSLHVMDETYPVNPSIDVKGYFCNAFGIWVDEENYPVQDIIIGVPETVARYWRTLPLHPSQREVGQEADKVLFGFRISMTPDFLGELKRWDVTEEDVKVDEIEKGE